MKNCLVFCRAISLPRIFFTLLGIVISIPAMASDFSMPFINGSNLGNAYSGWAAIAEDASTTYTNPAGLIKIPNQQLVFAAVGALGHSEFQGKATTLYSSESGSSSGRFGGFLPLFYYAAPIHKNAVFGFGINVPFGLGTNYPTDSIMRYSATRSQIVVVDFGPSVGIAINNKLSLGAGLDIERLTLKLNQMYASPIPVPDVQGQNYLSGWGYGAHGGILYQFTPQTRLGFNINSQVMFHPNGKSAVFSSTSGTFKIRQRANIALPAFAQLSFYHEIDQKWSAMASVFYTNWSVFNKVTLQNTVFPTGIRAPITVPFQYHNTIDYAIGVNYKALEKWIFKTGALVFNTPSNNRNRGIADPIGDSILVAIGGHYQQSKELNYDIGYAYNFCRQTVINNVTPVSTLSGHTTLGANILGGQITWNIA